ncbi:hypothetical protein ACFVZ3_43505 [Kitasatospora purpeofusca]|uniref:hypothetical protein n=1 Tax=Kitasatospora purpeofusca TaxID=67352 RepID=UPI00367CBD76
MTMMDMVFLKSWWGQRGLRSKIAAALLHLLLRTTAADPLRVLTEVGLVLAGRRRAHLRQAWMADLGGDVDSGIVLSPWRRRTLAAGFLWAGLRLGLRDTLGALWRPVDWVLASASRTRNTIAAATGTLAVYVDATGGLHQLMTTGAVICPTTTGTLYALAHWLRRVRGTEPTDRTSPPKRPGRG